MSPKLRLVSQPHAWPKHLATHLGLEWSWWPEVVNEQVAMGYSLPKVAGSGGWWGQWWGWKCKSLRRGVPTREEFHLPAHQTLVLAVQLVSIEMLATGQQAGSTEWTVILWIVTKVTFTSIFYYPFFLTYQSPYQCFLCHHVTWAWHHCSFVTTCHHSWCQPWEQGWLPVIKHGMSHCKLMIGEQAEQHWLKVE